MQVFILFLCAVTSAVHVNAIPIPEPHNPGDVVAVKPTAWGERNTLRHQAVVLTDADAANHHLIAPVSSNLPAATHPHVGDAHAIHPAFTEGHQITHTPVRVDGANMLPSQKIPTPVSPENLAKLKADITAKCGTQFTRRDGSCAMRSKPHPQKNAVHAAPGRNMKGGAISHTPGAPGRDPKAMGHTAGAKSGTSSARGRTAGAQGHVAGARGRTAPTPGHKTPARKVAAQGRKVPAQKARQAVQKKTTSRRK